MKILDLSSLLPGPLSSKLLMDEGAEVIKIESRVNVDMLKTLKPTKDGVSLSYLYLNESKNIIFLDLKNELDKQKFIELIKTSDILIENFKAGKMAKMKLGYEELKQINPKLIYCAITGFGYKHIFSKKSVHDLNILALSGFLDYSFRYNKNPTIPPIQIADILTSYTAALKILSAFSKKEGAFLDISMMDSIKYAYTLLAPAENFTEQNITSENNPLWGNFPCYHIYETKDNKYIALAAVENNLWNDFCADNNLAGLEDKQFSREISVITQIENVFKNKTRDEWAQVDNDYCLSPVYSHLEARNLKLIDF